MNGILILNKPGGWTSFDVVAKVRRLTGVRRVGHTGTLDPMATGVLVICLGQATRVSEYMVGYDKTYRAMIELGVETDTYDAQGEVTARSPVGVSEAALREALKTFTGDIRQIPPMFSAIKHEGKKLYNLARKGVEVEREARAVKIYSIEVIAFKSPILTIEVRCSSGTYIRSLAHDLGSALGCGAHLSALTRTAVGPFSLSQAATIETLEAVAASGTWTAWLLPTDVALKSFPAVTLSEDEKTRARHGMSVTPATGTASRASHTDLVRAYDPAGQMIGLMRYNRERDELRPEKIFN
jgi:tRNA pseudouridine55 synthase